MSALRAFAFGSPDGSLWGAVVDHGGCAVVLGTPTAGIGRASELALTEAPDGGWELRGEALRLTVAPLAAPEPGAGEAVVPGTPWTPGERPGLCRVTGESQALGGAVDVPGARVALPVSAAPASVRLFAAWLPDGAALGLLAVRPGAGDHPDGDRVAASLFDPEGWVAVDDPRLSSTYDASGTPTRASLELWITDGENEFPRRAAAEASGPAASVAGEGHALQVVPVRCHSRGEEGAGVYALATF